jgi:ribosomal protein L44E
VRNTIKYPQTQNLHCPQCADKENTNVVQRGVKNITKMSRRRHRADGGAEGPEAGGSLSKMARNIP